MIDKYGFFEQGRKSFLNFQRSFFQNYNSDLLLIDLEKLSFQKIENSIWIETATRKLTNSCKPEADIESWLIAEHRLFCFGQTLSSKDRPFSRNNLRRKVPDNDVLAYHNDVLVSLAYQFLLCMHRILKYLSHSIEVF